MKRTLTYFLLFISIYINNLDAQEQTEAIIVGKDTKQTMKANDQLKHNPNATYTINSVTWYDRVDLDMDEYTRSRRLRMNITASENTYASVRIWKDDGGGNVVYADIPCDGSGFLVQSGTRNYDITGFGSGQDCLNELTREIYDFAIFLKKWPDGTTLAFISDVQDPDLENEKFETALQDQDPQLADLIVENPNVPLSANPGQTIPISCRIRNVGVATASESKVGYYIASNPLGTDIFLQDDNVAALEPNAYDDEDQNVIIPATISPGLYYITFWADYETTVPESNENNNKTSLAIVVEENEIDITVTSAPPGRSIIVDGNTFTAPQTFNWSPGSSHSIGTTSPQSGGNGIQYVFSNWSDGGAVTHNITVPTTPTIFTANFTTQYYLTMSANPSNGGSVNPQSGWRDAGSSIQVSASSNSGWYFNSWTGSGSGSYSGSNNPANISMNEPISETANFAQNPIITITTNPSGRTIMVDGNTYTAPQTFNWTPGSSHSIGATSPQSGVTGTQYIFNNWSDGGFQTHNITVPSTPTTYTANFITQYYLTMSANPSNGGIVNPQSGWYNAGSLVQICATTNSGWYFTGWTGSGSGSYNGSNICANITMNGPISETANFAQNPTITITTNPSGRTITVEGNTYTSPQTFSWTPGTSKSIGTTSPQAGTTGTQYVFSNWSDGGAITHNITVPSTPTTYTANFTTQYYLTMSANPSNGGSVNPQSGWHDAGSSVQILANPNNNWDFDGWEGIGVGSYNGLNNPYNIIMNGPISETGKFKVRVGIEDLEFVSNIPTDYSLFNNYPNPFNPSTYIEFGLPEESVTQLKVYDILGKEVVVLLDNEIVSAGRFRYELDAKDLTSGIYIYVLMAQSTVSKQTFKSSKKMSLLK